MAFLWSLDEARSSTRTQAFLYEWIKMRVEGEKE